MINQNVKCSQDLFLSYLKVFLNLASEKNQTNFICRFMNGENGNMAQNLPKTCSLGQIQLIFTCGKIASEKHFSTKKMEKLCYSADISANKAFPAFCRKASFPERLLVKSEHIWPKIRVFCEFCAICASHTDISFGTNFPRECAYFPNFRIFV